MIAWVFGLHTCATDVLNSFVESYTHSLILMKFGMKKLFNLHTIKYT